MPDHAAVPRHNPISEVESWLTGLTNRSSRSQTRVLVENGGTPIAAIVSPGDLPRLDELDREREADFAVIDELHDLCKDVPAIEIERDVDRVLGTKAAVNGAVALGTRDRQLLSFDRYHDLRIPHPVDLLAIIEDEGIDGVEPGTVSKRLPVVSQPASTCRFNAAKRSSHTASMVASQDDASSSAAGVSA